jgi:4-hydroxy 2-oxovalerate aldolase
MTVEHKIVDCTVRDGGLVNDWDFTPEFVAELYTALNTAGVEYMEVGYKNSPKLLKGDAGPWRFLDDSYLKSIITNKDFTKLSALVDIGRVDEDDILPREDSLLDLIRVACYVSDVGKGIDLAKKFNERGYETSINIMALSHVLEKDLVESLKEINKSPIDVVYIVDSFGSITPNNMGYLVSLFKDHLPEKTLGVHTHNNMQLALANTLEAANHGVSFLDSSVYGMGRAAGNCHTELLVASLKDKRYEMRPILDIIERHMIKIRENWEWGYNIPYALAGILNEHPRIAMALRNSADRDKYVDFYDTLTSPESQPAVAHVKS